jgi:two-component system NtrC family sensor kinase
MALASPSLDEEAHEHLRVVLSQSERCRRLVRALLPFSRAYQADAEPTSVNELVTSVLQLREYSFRSAGIRAETVLSPSSPVVRVPAAEAQLAILNLVVNAEQALCDIEGPRWIRIRTVEEDGRGTVSIEDNGLGILPEDRDRVFESFYTTKPAGIGTGIGLTTARRVAERWGGSIVCEAGECGGARFILTWPLMSNVEVPADSCPLPNIAGLTVMAIDDEQFMLNFYRASLARRGCLVRTYRRGPDAVRELQREAPDVLLLDWVRPEEVTELTLDRLFREIPALRRRTVLVTGEPVAPQGADGLPVILKPFGLRELVEMIAEIAGRTSATEPTRIEGTSDDRKGFGAQEASVSPATG